MKECLERVVTEEWWLGSVMKVKMRIEELECRQCYCFFVFKMTEVVEVSK